MLENTPLETAFDLRYCATKVWAAHWTRREIRWLKPTNSLHAAISSKEEIGQMEVLFSHFQTLLTFYPHTRKEKAKKRANYF